MSTFRIATQTFEYRPRWVSYMVVDGGIRPKYDSVDLEAVGFKGKYFSHKKSFMEHTLTWPVTTPDLRTQLMALPLNKTVEMFDDVDNIYKNIQILKRVILPGRTAGIGIIYSATLNIRFIE